jgi:hypothetical protein
VFTLLFFIPSLPCQPSKPTHGIPDIQSKNYGGEAFTESFEVFPQEIAVLMGSQAACFLVCSLMYTNVEVDPRGDEGVLKISGGNESRKTPEPFSKIFFFFNSCYALLNPGRLYIFSHCRDESVKCGAPI